MPTQQIYPNLPEGYAPRRKLDKIIQVSHKRITDAVLKEIPSIQYVINPELSSKRTATAYCIESAREFFGKLQSVPETCPEGYAPKSALPTLLEVHHTRITETILARVPRVMYEYTLKTTHTKQGTAYLVTAVKELLDARKTKSSPK